MDFIRRYAHWTNKPIMFTEWMDGYNDGYIAGTAFPQWAVANGVVAVGYWDDNTGLISAHSGTRAGYQSSFGSMTFTGNALFTPKPVPHAALSAIGW